MFFSFPNCISLEAFETFCNVGNNPLVLFTVLNRYEFLIFQKMCTVASIVEGILYQFYGCSVLWRGICCYLTNGIFEENFEICQ